MDTNVKIGSVDDKFVIDGKGKKMYKSQKKALDKYNNKPEEKERRLLYQKTYASVFYERNKDKINAKNKERYHNNEDFKNYMKSYYQKNKDAILEKVKKRNQEKTRCAVTGSEEISQTIQSLTI